MLFHNKYLVYDVDHTGKTPLHWAAQRGFFDLILLLLKKGSDIDKQDMLGFSPLFYAVSEGNRREVLALLINEADPQLSTASRQGISSFCKDLKIKKFLTVAKMVLTIAILLIL